MDVITTGHVLEVFLSSFLKLYLNDFSWQVPKVKVLPYTINAASPDAIFSNFVFTPLSCISWKLVIKIHFPTDPSTQVVIAKTNDEELENRKDKR